MKIKTLFAIFGFQCLAISQAFSQSDVKGFRTATWGMSVDTVRQLFQNEITLHSQPKAYAGGYCPFTIENYMIDHYKYSVDFIFSSETNLLKQVNVFSEKTISWQMTLSSLESILIEKYGNPTFKGTNPYLSKWTFESSVISLQYIQVLNSISIRLIYTPNDNSNKSKL